MLKKSPSGSLCPYYYMGGELHPLKYGSYFDNMSDLLETMKAEETFILKSSGQHNRRIWIDLYETNLNDEVIKAIVLHIEAIKHKIFRLCLVGCSFSARQKINEKMKQTNIDIFKQMRFFSDSEEAKQWLIGERN